MSASDAALFVVLVVAGMAVYDGLYVCVRLLVRKVGRLRREKARKRALSSPFVASNQHVVYVGPCDCDRPGCDDVKVLVSAPDGSRAPFMMDLPEIGDERHLAAKLRTIAVAAQTPEGSRPATMAAAEFLDSMVSKGVRS